MDYTGCRPLPPRTGCKGYRLLLPRTGYMPLLQHTGYRGCRLSPPCMDCKDCTPWLLNMGCTDCRPLLPSRDCKDYKLWRLRMDYMQRLSSGAAHNSRLVRRQQMLNTDCTGCRDYRRHKLLCRDCTDCRPWLLNMDCMGYTL